MEKTFIHIEFWQLVGFLLSFLGICFTFGKMLLAQFREQQDERQKQQERLQGKVEIMETNWRNSMPACRSHTSCAKTTSVIKSSSKPKLDNVAEKTH